MKRGVGARSQPGLHPILVGLGSRCRFEALGPVPLKGKAQSVEVFALPPAQKIA